MPAAQRIVDNSRQGYAAGTSSFLELIEAQRTLLEVRVTAAEAWAAREKSLAELEALVGTEVNQPEVNQPGAEARGGVNHD